MKTLTLMRHAKSGHDPYVARDFDRALNAKGKRAAEMMGRHARGLGLRFDHAIASPAVRVSETIAAFEAGYGTALAAEPDRRLYLASSSALLEIVQATASSSDNILIIGHNPGLEDLALLLALPNSFRADILEKFPTASIARLSFAGQWREWGEATATLTDFIRPRDLDPGLGPDAD